MGRPSGATLHGIGGGGLGEGVRATYKKALSPLPQFLHLHPERPFHPYGRLAAHRADVFAVAAAIAAVRVDHRQFDPDALALRLTTSCSLKAMALGEVGQCSSHTMQSVPSV